MVFGGFPKKIRNKTFYFHTKIFFSLYFFLLSFGPRVYFRGQKLTFCLHYPECNFQSKTVKLSYFTLGKSFFFIFNQFFFIHIKVTHCCEGLPKINDNPVAYKRTWYLAVFQNKLGTKLFIFTLNFFFTLFFFLLSFGPRVHFQGQKLTFCSHHPEYNFQSKTVKLSYFTLGKSFFFHI
jgi:hypothetical protein